MNLNIDFEAIKSSLSSGLETLQNFHFTVSNPVFWIVLFFLFILLLRFWEHRKAFSYVIVLALILLATTQTEKLIGSAVGKYGETFDPILIRAVAGALLVLITLYYLFLRD